MRRNLINFSKCNFIIKKENIIFNPNEIFNKYYSNVHPDIKDFLWIGDGPKKNYKKKKAKKNIYRIDEDSYIDLTKDIEQEPSVIYFKLPVATDYDSETKGYNSCYIKCRCIDRRCYWEFLADPYNPNNCMSSVCMFHYGLERFLLTPKYEKALNILDKLCNTYLDNTYEQKSFRKSATTTYMYICYINNRKDLFNKLVEKLNLNYLHEFNDNIFLLCKLKFDSSLSPKEIMKLAKTFNFKKENYIKVYPEIFEEELQKNMKVKNLDSGIYISDYLENAKIKEFPKVWADRFCNYSIEDRYIEIPEIKSSSNLSNFIYSLLWDSHENVKLRLAEMRRSGLIKTNKIKKEVKIMPFNEEKEKECLKKYEETKGDAMSHYTAISELLGFYYECFTKIDKKFAAQCIKCCFEMIDLVPTIHQIEREKRIEEVRKFSDVLSKKVIEKSIEDIKNQWMGAHAVFLYRRIAIIYEKNKEYTNAVNICDVAMEYCTVSGNEMHIDDFLHRKERLLKRLNKKSSK